MNIRPMTPADHPAVYAFWEENLNASLSEDDDYATIERYLLRNPGLSMVAESNGRLIGTLLCGHDGRRGYFNHVAVAAGFRRQGIARAMAEEALRGLAAIGIQKCKLFVFGGNQTGQLAWEALGWQQREDLLVYEL